MYILIWDIFSNQRFLQTGFRIPFDTLTVGVFQIRPRRRPKRQRQTWVCSVRRQQETRHEIGTTSPGETFNQ